MGRDAWVNASLHIKHFSGVARSLEGCFFYITINNFPQKSSNLDYNNPFPSCHETWQENAMGSCLGGGYWILAYDLEGTDIARYLNSIGVAAIVLKYRLPTYGNTVESHKVPLMDAQRAMRIVRFNASKWNIDPAKIGIMGFSAGGHLASTLGTHFDFGNPSAIDSVEKMSCRPDFMVLMYPVISFSDSITHKGSREALLGKDPDKDLVRYYSNELQVRADTPPAFFVHANDDKAVPVENTLVMVKALREKNISVEMHILSEGGHGFGLKVGDEHIGSWTNSLKLWLNWLNKQPASK
jgi:acetyl esterase/lipase